MDCLIRKVQQGDEFDLAYIQTESWKAAFAKGTYRVRPCGLYSRG